MGRQRVVSALGGFDGYAPHVDLGSGRSSAQHQAPGIQPASRACSRTGREDHAGVTSAIFMIIGLLALPGALAGIDDPELAAWYVNAGLLTWMGTYLLYPAWYLWLSRRYGDSIG